VIPDGSGSTDSSGNDNTINDNLDNTDQPDPPKAISIYANAGPDQTVSPGVKVELDASGSYDKTFKIVSYHWMISAGTMMVNLTSKNTINPSFIAPDGNGWISFILSVENNNGETDTDTVSIWVASRPTADAGPDQTVTEGDSVLLDGSISSDPVSMISSYQWIQIDGLKVLFNNSTDMKLSFIAPEVEAADTLTFQFTVVNKNGETDSDTVNINVNKSGMNLPPNANANSDQVVSEDDMVTLDGYRSTDPDGVITGYLWEQIDESEFLISLSDKYSVAPTFMPPEVDQTITLSFLLTVSDENGSIDTDEVNIVVEDTPEGDSGKGCFISTIPE